MDWNIRYDLKDEDIKNLYNRGLSFGAISKRLGASRSTISRRLDRMGIVRRERLVALRTAIKKPINNEEIRDLYLNGASTVEIEKKVGLSNPIIGKRLRQMGVEIRNNRAENNVRWKGGKRIDKHGYVVVLNLNYPRSGKWPYIHEHRLVWERVNGKKIPKGYVIHHLNGIKNDNRPQNLCCMRMGEHINQSEPYRKRIRELEEENKRLRQLDLFKMD